MSGESPSSNEYRVKVALLGPGEPFNSAVLHRLAMQKMPDSCKSIIGVTMGSLRLETSLLSPPHSRTVQISIWDVDCSSPFARLREQYYRGSGAVLVILDEHTLDQASPYFREIQQQDPTIITGIVLLCEDDDSSKITRLLKDPSFQDFPHLYMQEPRKIILWVLEILGSNINNNVPPGQGGILYLPKESVIGKNAPPLQYLTYTPAIDHDAKSDAQQTVNLPIAERLITNLGFLVHDHVSVVVNKHGEFRVSLQDGTVRFTPQKCVKCKEGCKQHQNICIVAGSQGFASITNVKQAELLVLAKVLALRDGSLPKPVIRQISRSIKCPPHRG